ncbi:hypothetical protein [Sinorhizobium fredii]|uniref:hypothetical protein n=1 Tax=Rhizobium fredii TaxID=380 RepID=UPI000A4C685E|nr:hypothetical protein [Sinorhizobium fredii]WOS66706.1 hypothetical protein SFGR64A_23905 [Sinorhizobium fredii GR64]
MDYAFDFVGEQQVKNIEKPVRLYRVRLGDHGRITDGQGTSAASSAMALDSRRGGRSGAGSRQRGFLEQLSHTVG